MKLVISVFTFAKSSQPPLHLLCSAMSILVFPVSEEYFPLCLCLPHLILLECCPYFKVHFPCPFLHEIFPVSPSQMCFFILWAPKTLWIPAEALIVCIRGLTNICWMSFTCWPLGWVLGLERWRGQVGEGIGKVNLDLSKMLPSLEKFTLQCSGFLPSFCDGTRWGALKIPVPGSLA